MGLMFAKITMEKLKIVQPGWYGTLEFLAGMIEENDLIELGKGITRDYFNNYHHLPHDYLSSLSPNNDILLAGRCLFEEGKLDYLRSKNDFLESLYAHYTAELLTKLLP